MADGGFPVKVFPVDNQWRKTSVSSQHAIALQWRASRKRNGRWKSCFSTTLYKGRNAIERMFCRLKDCRRLATLR
jgi:transposase